MTDRLKACERWHPDGPSKLVIRLVKDGAGDVRESRRCLVCLRHQKRFEKAGLPKPPRLNRLSSDILKQPYGVLPRLTWAPPQI